MKKVVSFSGGRTSAYLCKLMIDKFGRDNVDFIFMDTGAEHKKTYEFIRKVDAELGLNLVCLRGDFTSPIGGGVNYKIVDIDSMEPDLLPYSEMIKKYGVPYIGGMFCTDRMKLKPFKKYCEATYGRGNYETWLGIRFDEPKRLVGDNKNKSLSAYKQLKECGFSDDSISLLFINCVQDNSFIDHVDISDLAKKLIKNRIKNLNKDNLNYMAQVTEVDKQDVINWWGKKDFDLSVDEWSGNCLFCPKKSDLKLAASQRDNPKEYIEFLEMINGDSVRIDDKTGSVEQMYRKKLSLEKVIAKFDGSTGDEIKSRIRGSKMIDAGSCSESCEVFGEQLDIFKGIK